jgi:hypothetical protein
MTDDVPHPGFSKHQELLLHVARQPRVFCCCICLSKDDRKRARRVFRLTRKVTRAWDKEREAVMKQDAAGSAESRT